MNLAVAASILRFGAWSFFGAWSLGFGASSTHSRIFLVGLEVEAHQDIVVGDCLHVLHVVFEADEVAEAEHRQHFDGRLLPANKLGLDFFEAQKTRDADDFRHEGPRKAPATV